MLEAGHSAVQADIQVGAGHVRQLVLDEQLYRRADRQRRL